MLDIRAVIAIPAALLALFFSSAALAGNTLTQPTDDAMCLLYYQLAKQPAPIDDFAAQASSVLQANEFDKQHSLDAEKKRLTDLAASLQTVTAVKVSIQMSTGEYDSSNGEYDLSGFSPNQFLMFECFHKGQVRLRFDNADTAQRWTLDPAAAESVLKKNPGRQVLVTATVDLTGVDATGSDDPPMMVGLVRDVTIDRAFFNTPLGHYTVAAQ